MTKIKLIDLVNVAPDKTLTSLSKKEKHSLMDSFFNRKTPEERGLRITYDLSHSGKRINNRIYTVRGQQAGADTILNPYPKPILLAHDEHADPIGRFSSGRWEDMTSQAMAFFHNVNDFMELQDAFDSDNPKKIAAALNKFSLLTNKNWPGLGRLRVQATISDESAIEKFLDGRYITFSAGSTTDRLVCSVCDTDWTTDSDYCDHLPGRIYDGELCFHITGKFDVLEGSVVNMPADDYAQIQSMEILDGPDFPLDNKDHQIDHRTLTLSDSIYNFTETVMPKRKKDNTTASEVATENTTTETATNTEVNTSEEEAATNAEATATTETTTEATTATEAEAAADTVEAGDLVEKVIESLIKKGVLTVTSDTTETAETTTETATTAETTEATTSETTEATNEKITTEASDDSDSDLKNVLKGILDRLENLETTTTVTTEATTTEEVEVAEEEINTEETTNELNDAFVVLGKALDKNTDNVKSDSVLETIKGWFSNSAETDLNTTVENPSEASSDTQDGSKVLDKATEDLGSFEKDVVIRYHSILDSTGQDAADRFFISKATYLPRGFHPNNYR